MNALGFLLLAGLLGWLLWPSWRAWLDDGDPDLRAVREHEAARRALRRIHERQRGSNG